MSMVVAFYRTVRATERGFITASGYRVAKSRSLSARAVSNQLHGGEVLRLHNENYGVYGFRKMHALI